MIRRFAAPAVFSVLFAFVVLELFLRAVWPQENMHLYEIRDGMIFNRAGFSDRTAMRPYASLSQLRRFLGMNDPLMAKDAPILKPRIEINSQGFRDDRDAIPLKKTRPVRVVNLGGSIGFGWPYPLEDTYLKRLEKNDPRIETLNCSIIAANSPQLVRVYEKLCSPFEHDWVLMQVTSSPNAAVPDYLTIDFWGADYRVHQSLWWTRRISLVAPEEIARRAALELVPSVDWSDAGLVGTIEDAYAPALPLYDALHVVRLIENVFLLTPRRIEDAPVIRAVREMQGQSWYPGIVRQMFAAGDHPTLKAIERVNELSRARGARLVVMIFPNHFDAESGNAARREDLRALMDALGRRKIPFIRADEWFAPDEIGRAYLPQDEHPTPWGYGRMAEVIGAKLRSLEQSVNER